MEKGMEFLPVSREEMIDRGWYYYDFLVVTADGYIDHPSFGTTLIARLLESKGYRVAILPQPDWHSAEAFRAMGRPRLGVAGAAAHPQEDAVSADERHAWRRVFHSVVVA